MHMLGQMKLKYVAQVFAVLISLSGISLERGLSTKSNRIFTTPLLDQVTYWHSSFKQLVELMAAKPFVFLAMLALWLWEWQCVSIS